MLQQIKGWGSHFETYKKFSSWDPQEELLQSNSVFKMTALVSG
jgi:hypothetical protein